MRMLFKVHPTTFVLWCFLVSQTLAAIDLDSIYDDHHKINHGSSIDSHSHRDEKQVYRSNFVNKNSPSVPYSNSDDEKSSYYENIKHSLSRLKSSITFLFSSNDERHSVVSNDIDSSNVPHKDLLLHRSKRQEEDDNEEEEDDIGDSEENNDPSEPEADNPGRGDTPGTAGDSQSGQDSLASDAGDSLSSTTDPAILENNVDDEDLVTGSGDLVSSGESGVDRSSEVPTSEETPLPPTLNTRLLPAYEDTISPGTPHVYRLTLIIEEPFSAEYLYPTSVAFKNMESGLAEGFNNTLKDLPGHRTIYIQGIHHRPEDSFTVKATLDLETINFYDNVTLENRIRQQINEFHRIGPFTVRKDGFTFRDFKGASELCYPGEIQCRSNYLCLPNEYRCDGFPNCMDESDEKDCPKVEVNNARCDKNEFMCDVTRCIPDSWRCNGTAECSDGTDEVNCAPSSRPVGK